MVLRKSGFPCWDALISNGPIPSASVVTVMVAVRVSGESFRRLKLMVMRLTVSLSYLLTCSQSLPPYSYCVFTSQMTFTGVTAIWKEAEPL